MRVCLECKRQYENGEIFCPVDGSRIIDPESKNCDLRRRSFAPPAIDKKDPLIGNIIQKRYRIIKKIGEGGMGIVYIAEHIEIEKKVAIKVLRNDYSNKSDVVERFRQEAKSTSKIGNPHIIDITDFGCLNNGGVFFVMELLEGFTLEQLCVGKVIPLKRAVKIIDQITRALQAAHDKGIVHRDLKPENIFLIKRDEQEDFVKILDFGIAKISNETSGKKLTQTGMIFGTPEYMSPEQAAGKALDHRVDIYSLGCIMFEMFTGIVPYSGDSFMAILTQHMFEPIPDIGFLVKDTDLPTSVQNVVYKALSKEPHDRYDSMNSLREDLFKALEDKDFVVNFSSRQQAITFESLKSNKRKSVFKLKNIVLLISIVLIILGATFFNFKNNKTEEKQHIEKESGYSLPSVEDLSPVAKKEISINISSIPTGATVFIENMGQVCSSTPCIIDVEPGKPISISAVLEDMVEKIFFTPSLHNDHLDFVFNKKPQEQTELQDKTTKTKQTSKAPVKRKKTINSDQSKNNETELKTPDIFRIK